MSESLQPVITRAGLAAVFNTQNNGLEAVISQIALGDEGWNPDDTATTLRSEKQRVAANGQRLNDHQIHLTGVASGELEYWVREVGFYLDDGTLLAIWSDENQPLIHKSSGVDVMLAFDLVLSALPAKSVTIEGEGGFNLPVATEEKRGIVRFGNDGEIAAGLLESVAVSPKHMKAAIQGRLTQEQADERYLIASTLVGCVEAFAAPTAPEGWIECNGAELSRTVYDHLFSVVGTTFGDGDGTTTFTLPDLRGEFIRGWDNGRGVDPSRSLGSWQTFTNARMSGTIESGSTSSNSSDNAYYPRLGSVNNTGLKPLRGASSNESRPRNIALMYCIKY